MPYTRKIITSVIAAMSLMGMATTAQAEEDKPYYIAGFIGAVFAQDQTATGQTAGGAPREVVTEFENGGLFGGAIGARVLNYGDATLRTELEATYRQVQVLDGSFNGGNQTFFGEQDVLTIMVNAAVDYDAFGGAVKPFVGVGIGVLNIDSNVQYRPPSGALLGLNNTTTNAAVQVFGGASVPLNEQVDFFFQGGYLTGLGEADFERRIVSAGGVLDSIVSERYEEASVRGGLRFNF